MKTVRVESVDGHPYTLVASDGRHAIAADEPLDEGGEDLGSGPYELLLSALGSCMAITAKMYARRKQWPLAGVILELTHEKVPARECKTCSPEEIAAAGPEGRIDVIEATIAFRGELSEEQTARLLEIANRCPVHRTLERGAKISGRLESSL